MVEGRVSGLGMNWKSEEWNEKKAASSRIYVRKSSGVLTEMGLIRHFANH